MRTHLSKFQFSPYIYFCNFWIRTHNLLMYKYRACQFAHSDYKHIFVIYKNAKLVFCIGLLFKIYQFLSTSKIFCYISYFTQTISFYFTRISNSLYSFYLRQKNVLESDVEIYLAKLSHNLKVTLSIANFENT